jgi:hypothetical protein
LNVPFLHVCKETGHRALVVLAAAHALVADMCWRLDSGSHVLTVGGQCGIASALKVGMDIVFASMALSSDTASRWWSSMIVRHSTGTVRWKLVYDYIAAPASHS